MTADSPKGPSGGGTGPGPFESETQGNSSDFPELVCGPAFSALGVGPARVSVHTCAPMAPTAYT